MQPATDRWYRSRYGAYAHGGACGIESAWSAGLGRRGGLAIDDGSCRFGLSSQLPARLPNQRFDDLLPSARVAPSVKIALHRRVWRELFRQGSPLAATPQDIEDRLHDLAQIEPPAAGPIAAAAASFGRSTPTRHRSGRFVTQSTALILGYERLWSTALCPPSNLCKSEGITSPPKPLTLSGQALRMKPQTSESDRYSI